ncbi:unnamed protein product [Clavelina lepadiformis]|uniref:Uncharacterized protein n=1 Tax=Clavelina lepadiformis TaxID=159417 RepID=A0ABP0G388_CLALP
MGCRALVSWDGLRTCSSAAVFVGTDRAWTKTCCDNIIRDSHEGQSLLRGALLAAGCNYSSTVYIFGDICVVLEPSF